MIEEPETYYASLPEGVWRAARDAQAFEDRHPELREIFARQGARAYQRAFSNLLRVERELWPEIVYEDILDVEYLDL